MNIADVEARLAILADMAKVDDEGAHAYEDALQRDVLEAIANGTAREPEQMARLALTSWEISFSRCYA